jgi:hypothetical protein
MSKVQATAIQPKLLKTYGDMWKTISSKGYVADFAEGQDCVLLWFHHYLPQDLLDLADSINQEEIIAEMDAACTIIHFWVGFTKLAGDQDSIMVVKYIQGLLQPGQKKENY